jgi:hypothetical protein
MLVLEDWRGGRRDSGKRLDAEIVGNSQCQRIALAFLAFLCFTGARCAR